MKHIVPAGQIEKRIRFIRGLRVMLDKDLAVLYGVATRQLNQQVRRNSRRFPRDFMIRLTRGEARSLRSQIVTFEKGRGRYGKYPPLAFTEQGVAMLSGVLNSPRAVEVNIEIMRAFVRLRVFLAGHRELAGRLGSLERKYESHDARIQEIFKAIRRLMMVEEKRPRRRIGYV